MGLTETSFIELVTIDKLSGKKYFPLKQDKINKHRSKMVCMGSQTVFCLTIICCDFWSSNIFSEITSPL